MRAKNKNVKPEKSRVFVIRQKMSNSGSIHDLNSDMRDREIRVPPKATHVLVLAAFYGGRGYSVHYSKETALGKARRLRAGSFSFLAFNSQGAHMDWDGYRFIRGNPELDLATA